MAWTQVLSDKVGFADGNAGHVITLVAPQAGDIDVFYVNSDTVVSTPSGFTLPANASQVNNQGAYGFYRIATGSEGANVTITTSGNFNAVAGWSRWRGGLAFDVAAGAQINSAVGGATPAIDTGTLAGTNELVVVAALLHRLASPEPNTPVWSTGYTGLTEVTQGTGTAGVTQFTAYRTDAGTAAETPSATWTDGAFDRYAIALAFTMDPGGPAEADASDTLTVSDAATRTLTQSRAPADTVTLSDTPSRTVSRPRAAADTVTLADAATRTLALGAAPADTVTLSDSAAAVPLYLAAASDSATLSDQATAVVTLTRAIADVLHLADTASRTLSVSRTAGDTLAVSDAAVGAFGVTRTASDSLTLSDAATRVLVLTARAADTVTLSDAATRASLTFTRLAADTLHLADAAAPVAGGTDITLVAGSPYTGWAAGAPYI